VKLPNDIQRLLARRFATQHRDWLLAGPHDATWPLKIPLGVPSEPEALKQVDAVKQWAEAWHAWRGAGQLTWIERRWRVLGAQRLPESVILRSAAEVAAWIGEDGRWSRAEQRYRTLCSRWPMLASQFAGRFDVLADYSDSDLTRVCDVLSWLNANPESGLYPRQIPVAGVDTKWLESRQQLLRDLLAGLRLQKPEEGDGFHSVCGLRQPPARMRLRILDPELRASLRGLGDITAPVAEIAALDLPASRFVVVENVQSGLALPDMPATVAFMGLGYSVDLLGQVTWLAKLDGLYWGDIDTHGFAILSRARKYLPQLRSVLMDEETMLAHRDLWSSEITQATVLELPALTPSELDVYQALRANTWGQKVRLEQERIAWPSVTMDGRF
jgi:hypothetical protein